MSERDSNCFEDRGCRPRNSMGFRTVPSSHSQKLWRKLASPNPNLRRWRVSSTAPNPQAVGFIGFTRSKAAAESSIGNSSGGATEIRTENMADSPATQCRSNPVSGRSLPKNGIFQISAGDLWLFWAGSSQIRSPETGHQFSRRPLASVFGNVGVKSAGARLPGSLGREGSNRRMVESKSTGVTRYHRSTPPPSWC
jgi:hypothetical protein